MDCQQSVDENKIIQKSPKLQMRKYSTDPLPIVVTYKPSWPHNKWVPFSQGFRSFFHVQNIARTVAHGKSLTFQDEILNIGKGMNLSTGIFSVPVTGIYHFVYKGYKIISYHRRERNLRLLILVIVSLCFASFVMLKLNYIVVIYEEIVRKITQN